MTNEVKFDLTARIIEIGNEMTGCGKRCDGIRCDQTNGFLPRCLFLERDEGKSDLGCAVVGLNPGKSTDDERRFYRDGNSTYAAAVDWWQSNAESDSQYYRMLSKLLVKVGVSGPILWTELVKCELASETMRFRELPKATRIRCRENYLLRELDVLPHSWPIIATGRSAFKEVKQLQTGRTVIGLPHPTGSRGMFAKLFAAPELGQIQQIRFGPPGRVEWINGKS